jgi:hypothetical protein
MFGQSAKIKQIALNAGQQPQINADDADQIGVIRVYLRPQFILTTT